ncbi:unnamed protein product [Aphanomyces euteiches]
MSDNEEATSVKTRALMLARMVQEAAEAVGTANVGLERAMELLEVSVQQSQELADEAKDNKALTLDEFEAWTTAAKLQKVVVSKDFESKRATSSSRAKKQGAIRQQERDTESQASVDSDDSDQGEHDKTVVLRMAMADVIDASGVHHLRHIEMPELVKAAYMSLESQEPWVHWIGHFRSFLPGLTASQRTSVGTNFKKVA